MRRAILFFAFAAVAWCQPTPSNPVRWVTSDPTGSCNSHAPLQYNYTNGDLSGCNNGTYATIGGGGGGGGNPGGTTGQIQFKANSTTFGGFTLSGDCSANTSTGVITCTKINGTTPGGSCTNQVVTSISSSGVPTCSAVANAMLANSAITIAGTSVSLGGSTSSLPSPGPIGAGTPSTGAFTTVSVGNTVTTQGVASLFANASSTGTTANTLTKLTGAPSTAVIAATTDTGGMIGITISGAGTTGNATVQTSGLVNCVFSGGTTAGDYVQISSATAGKCVDSGAATYPTSGQVLGRVLSTNGGAGTYQIDLFPSEIDAAAAGNSVNVNGSSVSSPNFNSSSPSPDSGYFAAPLKVTGSNVIVEIPGPVYTTQSSGVTTNISPVTMVTTGAATHAYSFAGQVSLTAAGVTCTGNSSVTLNAIFTDPATSSPITVQLGTLTLADSTSSYLGTVGFIASFPPFTILAKASTTISYSTSSYTSGCSGTNPTYQVSPILTLVW